ncbi:MAG: hypothetical protein IH936_05070 [Acidobacteria bacterium]|nr:hypothetical protein [Acidobacteriota bacterium]
MTVPNLATTMARLKVACSNNIFFDISDANFTVTAAGCSGGVPATLDLSTQQIGTVIHEACETITVQNGFSMAPGANVTLQAGERVIFENGSSAGNLLSVVIALP